MGLKRSLAFAEIENLAGDPVPAHRIGALLILRESGQPEARALVHRFLDDSDPIDPIRRDPVGRRATTGGVIGRSSCRELSRGTHARGFEGTLAALEMLDARKRSPREEASGDDYIASLLADSRTPAAVFAGGCGCFVPIIPY